MRKPFIWNALIMGIVAFLGATLLQSCGTTRNQIVPHAVSSADAIPASALNLKKGDYDILATVTESASVTAKYSSNQLKVTSGDGDFSYTFVLNPKFGGWVLQSFSGIANFGYLVSDANGFSEIPEAEEFARRVAIAKLIELVKDYKADGVLEPVITTRATNTGRNTVEYQATVMAKIVKIKPTVK